MPGTLAITFKDYADIKAEKSTYRVRPLVTTDNLDDHARQRRIVGTALSDRALYEQEYILKQYTDLLVEKLHEKIKNENEGFVNLDIGRYYNYTTFDTIGDLQFGESFHALESSAEHPWVSALFNGLKFGMLLTIFHHLPPLKSTWLMPQFIMDKAAEHHQWACQQVEKRIKTETDRPDFMKHLLKKNEDGRGMTRDEVDANATLLILAGSETSATTCTSVTWFLLKNPQTMKKLQEEIRGAFQSIEDITIASAASLPYLHAVIKEALRLHPPGPTSSPRLVDRPGVIVSGHLIPKGVSSVSRYRRYHRRLIFSRLELEFLRKQHIDRRQISWT